MEDRVKTFEFSSVRKSMTVVINHENEHGDKFYRVLTKGASEKVLEMCNYIIDGNDDVSVVVKLLLFSVYIVVYFRWLI